MENFNKGYIEDIEWGKIQVNKRVYQHDVIIEKGVNGDMITIFDNQVHITAFVC